MEDYMKKTHYKIIYFLTIFLLVFISGPAFAWHDKTHMVISQAAGYENWYNSAAADVTKTKAGDAEANNHWYNNNAGIDVSDKMVLDQVGRYNNPGDAEGHLYGAIIASLRDYIKEIKDPGKYAEYHMAFCAHYIGDLSMPLHNMPYGKFNDKDRHSRYDGTIELSVLNNIGLIQKNMYEIKIRNESDLIREVARIANISHQLALKLEKDNKDMMSQDEAYAQIYHSASLLKAVLTYVKTLK
jgi:hypothetical protein